MIDARFPRSARVRARADFDRIFRDGRRVALPALALHWLGEPNPARLGLAVSRKVDPHAVGRNRIKRILRDHFRHLRPALAAGAYVIVARPPAASAAPIALREAFTALLRRAGALPHPAAGGTMPAADSRPAFPPSPVAPCSDGE
ncbi:ribonuclease P protein component [Luteimonas viscosa]|uniref:Ribonuclease P protein component n=1 Tax=Luteimonas viscosa TaxID=1132694 RepID=A0A5D4XRV8_9GAMM|nr:ribonuclease P protein component [Luteimonas viscosa]TYT26501.1 ribonuclease P protein component [Luteimonas viscosa]